MHILKGVRPLDVVLTALLVAAAVVIALGNAASPPGADLAHPIDSRSVLMVPVFVLAVLPILVRRRALLPAIAASTLVLAASLPAFGWVTRCGFALPLAAAYAYAVARFVRGRAAQAAGLALVLLLQLVTLVMDASTGGLDGLTLGVPLAAVCWGVGLLVQALVRRRTVAPTLTREHSNA